MNCHASIYTGFDCLGLCSTHQEREDFRRTKRPHVGIIFKIMESKK